MRTGRTGDEVYGVIFEIDPAEKRRLDEVEGRGKGYTEVEVEFAAPSTETRAFAYVAEAAFIDESLKPYTWYKELVVVGAGRNDLPREYVRRLEAVEAVEDPDPLRAKKARAVLRDGEPTP